MKKKWINCNGRLVNLSEPVVMGILNLTPDSFFDGGKHTSNYLFQVEKMLNEGAKIIDVGSMSSRPGSHFVSEEEECARLLEPITSICNRFPEALISVDTFRGRVAEEAIQRGAAMINDISAGSLDSSLFEVVARYRVPYVLMHMQGTPSDMQSNPTYHNVTAELIQFFAQKIHDLRQLGMLDILIDPGFGFGKSLEHNYTLLKQLDLFQMLEQPLLVGVSRKSMVKKVLNIKAEDALNGTTALHMVALQKGAAILRVHDVKEAVQCLQLFKQMEVAG
jgi:dihydropteroate synthase